MKGDAPGIPDAPEPGTLIGRRYRLVRKLGEGGMGTVFEALDEELGGHVAIKVIRHGLKESPNSVTRFKREAEAASAAGHEAIVGVFDFGVTDEGTYYLVMEYLVGMSLCDLLDERGTLDVSTTAYVGCQVLSGLSAAHRVGVVHRDLKPDNIFLIDPHSPTPGVKILDFGTSLLTGERGGGMFMTRITREGTVIGTPEYMSTEQARGVMDIDLRTDLYSLGVIIYECLVARPPFMSRQPTEIIYKILTEDPASLRTIRPDIPEAFEALVMWAISRDRDQRPQTSVEFFNALLPYVDATARGRIITPVAEQDEIEAIDFETRQISIEDIELRSRDAAIPLKAPEIETVHAKSGAVDDYAATIPMRPADVEAFIAQRQAAAEAQTIALDRSSRSPLESRTLVRSPSMISTIRPTGLVILMFIALSLLVVGLGVTAGLWYALNETTETPVAKPAEPRPAPENAPSEHVESRQHGDTGPRANSEICEIHLNNLPDGARVYVDGALVDEPPLRLVRGSTALSLRVEADGYEPFERVIEPSDDQIIDVVMASIEQ